MKEKPPAKRGLRFGKLRWWALAIFLAGCGYAAWREYDYRSAVNEAKAAGFEWECSDPISLVRQDWHNALKKETWGAYRRTLTRGYRKNADIPELARYRDLFRRLRPTDIVVDCCSDGNLDALKGLTSLHILRVGDCPFLQNIDALKGLTGLQGVSLGDYTRNFSVFLMGCPVLQNVDALKGLGGLQWLDLTLCRNIPATSLRELRAALPNTDITFPNGKNDPPQ